MKKDFDAEAWTKRHKEGSKGYAGFDELIASARAKVEIVKAKADEQSAKNAASETQIQNSETAPVDAPKLPPLSTQPSDMEQLKAEQQAIAAQTTPFTTTSNVEPISGAATFFQHAAEDIPMRDPTPSPDFDPPRSSQNERGTAHEERRHSNPRPPSSSQPQITPSSSFQDQTSAGSPLIASLQNENSIGDKVAGSSREESMGSLERTRRVPMFRVPEEPVKDSEGFGAAAG